MCIWYVCVNQILHIDTGILLVDYLGPKGPSEISVDIRLKEIYWSV